MSFSRKKAWPGCWTAAPPGLHTEPACSQRALVFQSCCSPCQSPLAVRTQGPLAIGNGQAFSKSPLGDRGLQSHHCHARCPELWFQPGPSPKCL